MPEALKEAQIESPSALRATETEATWNAEKGGEQAVLLGSNVWTTRAKLQIDYIYVCIIQ